MLKSTITIWWSRRD